MAKFADFQKEADRKIQRSGHKVNRTAFRIEFDDASDYIEVPYPTADVSLQIAGLPESDTLGILRALFRNNPKGYGRLIEEIQGQPIEVLQELIEGMYDHWNSDILEVPGKSKA